MKIQGFLVVDKPAGVTSHDVVAAVRACTGVKKVGHTGTLDPFATGVLPLALGRSTRLVQFLDESIKVYDAHIQLGAATDTGDPTGEVIREAPVPPLERAGVEAVLSTFLGERMQEPPAYSAVKVDGKPLYHYARKGQKVRAAPRAIMVHHLELLGLEPDTLRVRITCGRGTYARVLADEIATALGTAGHLKALCRDRSGPFYMEDAVDLPTLADWVRTAPGPDWRAVLMARRGEERVPWRPRDEVRAAVAEHMRSEVTSLGHLPMVDVPAADLVRVRNGGTPPPAPRGSRLGQRYLLVSGAELIAVAEHGTEGPKLLRVA